MASISMEIWTAMRASGDGRASMAPPQDPLAIAAQTLLTAPYTMQYSYCEVTIKLCRWFGQYVGAIERIEYG